MKAGYLLGILIAVTGLFGCEKEVTKLPLKQSKTKKSRGSPSLEMNGGDHELFVSPDFGKYFFAGRSLLQVDTSLGGSLADRSSFGDLSADFQSSYTLSPTSSKSKSFLWQRYFQRDADNLRKDPTKLPSLLQLRQQIESEQ